MLGFRDRDFLQTPERFFFCVIGSLHPLDRVISYIKYIPSDSGAWGVEEKRFSRLLQKYTIPDLLKTFNYLEQKYPQYLFNSVTDNITITAVPHENIVTHFKPEEKLAQLRQASKVDSLQDKLLRFTTFLEETSGVSKESFGITGSILLDIHQPTFSDLDIIVYGVKESWALKTALTENRSPELPMHYLEGKALEDWCIKKSKQYPLTAKDAFNIYGRKWNLGFFEDKWVSIHPVKFESEITEHYGEKTFTPYGQVKIEAVVTENVDSLFLPATYQIKDANILEGSQSADIIEVVSYESLYDSLAEKGEKIQAKGKLEKVTDNKTNRHYYRVLVGSPEGKGNEYVLVKTK